MSTRGISWELGGGSKGGGCVGLTTVPPSCDACIEIQPPGALRACPSLLWASLFSHKGLVVELTYLSHYMP
jgi:hypothetical protein